VTVGAAFVTMIVVVAAAEDSSVVSVGVKVTDTGCDPTPRMLPAAGLYAKLPGTLAVALSWAGPRVVP
jgi:hypothetical protein